MFKKLFFIFFIFLLCSNSKSDELDNLILDGKDKEAYELALKKANEGDPRSLCFAGYMYLTGTYVKQDFSKALYYYKKSADLGYPQAMGNMGLLYLDGEGVKKDIRKALEYFVKAAQKGNATGKINIANMLCKGETAAFDYFEKQMAKGDIPAILELGNFYKEAFFADSNESRLASWEKAEKCYLKGAELGDTVSMISLGNVWNDRVSYASDEKKSMELQIKAIEWYMKAYDKGDIRGIIKIGDACIPKNEYDKYLELKKRCYLKAVEKGCPEGYSHLGDYYYLREDEKAFEYYKKAVEMGNTDSIVRLSKLYNSVKKDPVSAFKLALKASERRDYSAWYLLGNYYRDGIGTEKNEQKAYNLYLEVSEKPYFYHYSEEKFRTGNYGSILVNNDLGRLCLKKKDYKKAWKCLNKVYQQQLHYSLMDRLGYMCEHGLGVEKDIERAIGFYESGASYNNSSECILNLAPYYIEGIYVKKNYKKIKDLLKRFTDLMRNPLAEAYLARIAKHERKNTEEVLSHIKIAFKYRAYSDPVVRKNSSLNEDRDYEEDALKVIMEDNPDLPLVIYKHAESLYRKGDKKKAIDEFSKLYKADPEDKLVNDYISVINEDISWKSNKTVNLKSSEKRPDKLKIAVLNISKDYPVVDEAADAITLELMKAQNFNVVEREKIKEIFKEYSFSDGAKSALNQNALLQADILMALSIESDMEGRTFIKVAAFDVKRGLRVFETSLPLNTTVVMAKSMETVGKILDAAGKKGNRIFSIYPFMNKEQSSKNDCYQEILSSCFRTAFLSKGVLISEFEESRRISDELNTGKGNALPESSEISSFRGEFSSHEKDGKKFLDLTICRNIPSDKSITVYNDSIGLDKNGIPLKNDIAKLLDKLINENPSTYKKISSSDEFKKLTDSAALHIKSNSLEAARQELEAALFIDPSSVDIRKQLLKIYHTWMLAADKKSKHFSQAEPERYYDYYNRYLEHLEWLVRKKENIDDKLLYYGDSEGMWGLSDKTKKNDMCNRLRLICENILRSGFADPEMFDKTINVYEKLLEKIYNKTADKMMREFIVKNSNNLLRGAYPLIISNGLMYEDMCYYRYHDHLNSLLENKSISPELRYFLLKELKYINEYTIRDAVPIPVLSPLDNSIELKKLSLEPSQEILSLSKEKLLKKANESFTTNDYNSARLYYEAYLAGKNKLELGDEWDLIISYIYILRTFPYSLNATERERDIALKFCERGMSGVERIFSNHIPLKKNPFGMYSVNIPLKGSLGDIRDIVYFKKFLDLGTDFEAKLSSEQHQRVDSLMKRLKVLCEDKDFPPYSNYYRDTYFWCYKDDETRIKEATKLFDRKSIALNIYFCKYPEQSRKLIDAFLVRPGQLKTRDNFTSVDKYVTNNKLTRLIEDCLKK